MNRLVPNFKYSLRTDNIYLRYFFVTCFLAVIWFLPLSASGQINSRNAISFESKISFDYLEDTKLQVLVGSRWGQNAPFAGMEFPVNSGPVANFGFDAGYKFFPNKNPQNFDFFFIYIIKAVSRKLYPASTTNGFSLQNLVGYGFNVHFRDRIWLIHHLAAGIENARFKGYGNFADLSLSACLGIGIKIKSK